MRGLCVALTEAHGTTRKQPSHFLHTVRAVMLPKTRPFAP